MPTLADKKTLFDPFQASKVASFPSFSEKVRAESVGNRHQSAYSSPTTKIININHTSKVFHNWKNDKLLYGLIEVTDRNTN